MKTWSLKASVDLFLLHFDSKYLPTPPGVLAVSEARRRAQEHFPCSQSSCMPWLTRTRSVFPSVWTLVRLRASCSSSRSDTSSSSSGVWKGRTGLIHSLAHWGTCCSCQTDPVGSKGRSDKHQSAPFQPLLNSVFKLLLAKVSNEKPSLTRMDWECVTYQFY